MSQEQHKVRLGDVALINPRRPLLRRTAVAPTTFVPMQAIDEKSGIILAAEVRQYSTVAKGYTYFESGDVLFAKITPCMQNGKHAVARELIDGIGFGSTEFHVLRPTARLHPEWLHLFLRQRSVLDAAERAFTGSVGQQRVPEEFLSELQIPLPSMTEQERFQARLKSGLSIGYQAISDTHDQIDLGARLMPALLRAEFSDSPPITTSSSGLKTGRG